MVPVHSDLAWTFLAVVPEPGGYVNLYKIATVAVLSVFWALGMQWVDRDTDVVKTKREQWNLMLIAGATVGYFVLFVIPWQSSLFPVGLALWFAFTGGSMIAYLLHRNARVVPAARYLTIGHFKRMFQGDPEKRKAIRTKDQRVHLEDHNGDPVDIPEDDEEAKDYEAVQDFLFELLWRRASDADLTADKERYRLIERIDGVACEQSDGLSMEKGERILRLLKRIAGLNVQEIRRPQTGRIRAALLGHEGEPHTTEIRTSGTTAGERLRISIQSGPALLRIQQLGLPKSRLESLKTEILLRPTGLFLMSALPQNGLTTTQYAILRSHDAYMNNIHALERRLLVELDNITQQVFEGSNVDVNYARMLQSVLRREPDIVMVGECEDRETAQIASRAAAEDRKIYLGIKAKDTFDALRKYLAFVDDKKLAAKALLGVMHQRLLRVLCEECRESYEPDAATLKKLNLPVAKIERFYRPPTEVKTDRRGKPIRCSNCQGTGYHGRTIVLELMVVDSAVKELIETGAPISRIKSQCRKNKMYYLQEEGLLKVIDKTTSMNEVLRCLRDDAS